MEPPPSRDVDTELELGLSLGGGGGGVVKFLTAQDLPSRLKHKTICGNKRHADHQHHIYVSSSSPPLSSQVVGWPPVGSYRMNNHANQTRTSNSDDDEKMNNDCGNKKMSKAPLVQENPTLGFVKVNMDGVQIGRKLDLSLHLSYESLAHTIDNMFFKPSKNSISAEMDQQGKASKLLDGSSEYVLTYEDKEGDWMLVGDVPFGMFPSTVKRLRIMRTSEANGLAPRSQERHDKVRSKPV